MKGSLTIVKLEKLVAGKNLTETEFTVLLYLVANIDRVLDLGRTRRGESELHIGRDRHAVSTQNGLSRFRRDAV